MIRPTKTTLGPVRVDAEPLEHVGAVVRGVLLGVDAVVDHLDPVRVDRRVGGQHVARACRRETAMIASAASIAVRSHQEDSAYPPPSCSAFHGRSGSRLCVVTTCGTPCSSLAVCPAKFAYQVWLCTRSVPAQPAAISRSTPIVRSAAFAPASSAGSAYAVTPGSVARRAEAVHPHVGEPAQVPGQVLDVHAGAAVHLRRVLPGEQVDAQRRAGSRAGVVTSHPSAEVARSSGEVGARMDSV